MATTRKAPARRGRPPANPRARKTTPPPAAEPDDLIGGGATADEVQELANGLDLGVVYGGVSASWLAHVFGMDKNTVKKKLANGNCTIVGKNKGTPLYTIKEAAGFLIAPKVDLATYVKSLRPNDLPPILNDSYWAAMLKRQKWEENAGDLWRTNDVMDVFGTLATRIKSTIQLWPENVKGLTDAQRLSLQQQTDSLLNDIHDIMVAAPLERRTPSSAEEPDDSGEDELV